MTIRVGLIGYGLAGSVFHAPLIDACERMELAAVLTSRDAPNRVASIEELIDRSDLVVVASPNTTHFTLANQAPDLARRAADRIRGELMGYLNAVEQVKPKIGNSKG